MRAFRALLHRLRGIFRRRVLEDEMQEELQAHLDGLTERNIAAGMSPRDARDAALRIFGSVTQIQERARDQRRSLWLEQLGQDVRYAVRSLAKAPSFTITAVLTLALGIGVNAALFSVFNMAGLRPLPVLDPEGLVRVVGRDARGGEQANFSYAEYVACRDGNRTLASLLARYEARVKYAPLDDADGPPRTVPLELVSENYFDLLGGRLLFGRSFAPNEVQPGAGPVVVLSHWFWARYFQSDPNVVGTTFRLQQRIVTVVGVAEPQFAGPQAVPPAAWAPLFLFSERPSDFGPTGPNTFRLIGRLKPGFGHVQAKADLDGLFARRATEFPSPSAKTSVKLERNFHLVDFTRSPQGMAFLGTIFVAFGLVLAVACTNVANLLLARGIARQTEIGVRLTLGAGRGRILGQLLTENALLCGLGAVLGLGFSVWTLQVMRPLAIERIPVELLADIGQLPAFDLTPDMRVFGFTALLTLGATVFAGLLPAWQAANADLYGAMRGGGTAFGRRFSSSRLRRFLIVGQVAISLMLLSCAGVLARNFYVVQQDEIGFDPDAVFTVELTPNPAIADRAIAFRQALETVRSMPGVAGATVANGAPLIGRASTIRIRMPDSGGSDAGEEIARSFITEGFFDTFGTPLLRGRTFAEREQGTGARAIIVSETLARRLWPGQEAVGKLLAVHEVAWAGREQRVPPEAFRECEVVGVARDIGQGLNGEDRARLYLPFDLETAKAGPVFVRPRSDSAAALAEIVRTAESRGVELHMGSRLSLWRKSIMMPFYFLATVSGALGLLALGLASVGLYGVMTFVVQQRVREIGVRVALGATAKNVVSLFVRQGMRLVAVGLVFGLIGGRLLALVLEKVTFGHVDGFNAAIFGAVTLLFALIAFFACWFPARRATKVDPMVALRAE